MEDILELTRQHFSRDNFVNLLGAELLEIKRGYAKAKLVLHDKHLNAHGVVHGGAIFSLADFTLGVAGASYGTTVLAVQASINFLHPAKTGALFAEARELSKGRKIANYQVTVHDDNGTLIASFIGVTYDKELPLQGN